MAKAAKSSGSPGPEHRVVLLHGANTFLAAEYTTQLKDKLQAAHGALDVLHFDGKEHKLADVLDECRSFGLMQQHKMVVVDSAEELVKEDNRPLVERYAEQPTEGATLVLRATKWYKGKLDDKIAAVGIMVECGDIGEAMARTWAIRRALKLAVEADAGVKSGLGDAERTLEVVAVRLTAMLRPRAAR
jgi:DNA polymerase III delta subunit